MIAQILLRPRHPLSGAGGSVGVHTEAVVGNYHRPSWALATQVSKNYEPKVDGASMWTTHRGLRRPRDSPGYEDMTKKDTANSQGDVRGRLAAHENELRLAVPVTPYGGP